jgi:hypothetical protein
MPAPGAIGRLKVKFLACASAVKRASHVRFVLPTVRSLWRLTALDDFRNWLIREAA